VALVFIGWEPIVNSFKTEPKKAVQNPLSSAKAPDDPTYADPLLGGTAPQKNFAIQITDERSLTDPTARPAESNKKGFKLF
jgi:hypothetical protein